MAQISLDRVVTGNYVLALGQAQSGGKGFDVRSLTNPQSSTDALRSSLRIGAQTFAAAVQNLNSTITYLNVTEGTLQELSGITDKLIDVTRRATLSSTGAQGRGALNLEYKKLAEKFKKVIDDATVGQRQYTSIDDLSAIFQSVGLDQTTSESIAEVFSHFVNPAKDDNLASDVGIKGKHAVIPPGAYAKSGTATGAYIPEKVSVRPSDSGAAVAQGYSVYLDSAANALYIKSTDGSTSTLTATGETMTLVGVNETTGYSVVKANDNFVGYNGTNDEQLFLVDPTGTVVQQFTNNSSGIPVLVTSLDIASNNCTIAFSGISDGVTGIQVYNCGTEVGRDPSSVFRQTITTAGDVENYRRVKLSDDTSAVDSGKIAYLDSSTSAVTFADLSSLAENHFLVSQTDISDFGFTSDTELAVLHGTDISTIDYSDPGYASTLVTGVSALAFKTIQAGSGYFAYQDASNGDIKLLTARGVSVASYDLALSDTIANQGLTLAQNGSNIDIGVNGILKSQLTYDTDQELYRFTKDSGTSNLSLLKSSKEYDRVFATDRSIVRRADAYQMLEDLKALKDVLKKNIDAVAHATEVVGENLKLIRASGFAFLDQSNAITNETDADKVAQQLVEAIRNNAKGALNQTENLNPITVAALAALSSSSSASSK